MVREAEQVAARRAQHSPAIRGWLMRLLASTQLDGAGDASSQVHYGDVEMHLHRSLAGGHDAGATSCDRWAASQHDPCLTTTKSVVIRCGSPPSRSAQNLATTSGSWHASTVVVHRIDVMNRVCRVASGLRLPGRPGPGQTGSRRTPTPTTTPPGGCSTYQLLLRGGGLSGLSHHRCRGPRERQWTYYNVTGATLSNTYDPVSRLTQVVVTGGSNPRTISYGYDAAGNRTSSAQTGTTPQTQTLTYNAANQITSFGYSFEPPATAPPAPGGPRPTTPSSNRSAKKRGQVIPMMGSPLESVRP